LPLNPMTGAKVQTMIVETVSAPPEVVARLRKILGF